MLPLSCSTALRQYHAITWGSLFVVETSNHITRLENLCMQELIMLVIVMNSNNKMMKKTVTILLKSITKALSLLALLSTLLTHQYIHGLESHNSLTYRSHRYAKLHQDPATKVVKPKVLVNVHRQVLTQQQDNTHTFIQYVLRFSLCWRLLFES